MSCVWLEDSQTWCCIVAIKLSCETIIVVQTKKLKKPNLKGLCVVELRKPNIKGLWIVRSNPLRHIKESYIAYFVLLCERTFWVVQRLNIHKMNVVKIEMLKWMHRLSNTIKKINNKHKHRHCFLKLYRYIFCLNMTSFCS